MKIMVTGSGGREHALAWRIAQSENVERVYVVPGNAGSAADEKLENVDLDIMDFNAQITFAMDHHVDLTIIGPEGPLVAGVVDAFSAAGLNCFGPTASAAQLEGSKTFTKDFLKRFQIPTANYGSFEDVDLAVEFVATMHLPVVIKADGLAAGKGVVIAQTLAEAERSIVDMLSGNAFGEAGARVVIEEFLVGEEASFIVMVDGENFLPFATSQDHKAALDGDNGPNTGGMGAYSPAPVVDADVHQRIIDKVIRPTIAGMAELGTPYVGFLYAGLMIDNAGEPSVIEFNCRFGDPETQPIMMRLKSDLAQLCVSALAGNLAGEQLEFIDDKALTVVATAGGYPGSYDSGKVIQGLEKVNEYKNAKVFHAGTRMQGEHIVTSGGRVLGITACGSSVKEAQQVAYELLGKIHFEGITFRSDIGYRAVARENEKLEN